jgi:sortase (surface protein transpeptidase)
MPKGKKHKGGMWEYLETLGVLENGNDEEIKQAKKAYRKEYYLKYKRSQRHQKPEFTVNFSTDKGEYSKVVSASKRHNLTITAFIRSAVLAYINQSFLVPNPDQIAALEQILSQCLNEVQSIVQAKEKYHWEREQKFEAIEKRIEKLETEIDQVFRNPPLIHDN